MKSKHFIYRDVMGRIQERLFQGKAVILLGPRQSGKTTLIKAVLERSGESYLMLNADEPDVRELLQDATSTRLKTIIKGNQIVCIDEAQRISNIGLTLKLMTDEIPEVQVIATGSSSLELNTSIAEPLTGRKFEFALPPLSFNEIGQLTGADSHTVERYIDLLEKAFVIFTLPAYSRNIRNEIKKSRKIYFLDNGIRNAVIGNFLAPASRTDTGALWENYLISERRKMTGNKGMKADAFFWRTTQQQEIDYIEEQGETLYACEFKWNPKKKDAGFPKTFLKGYLKAKTLLLTPDNYDMFLTSPTL